MGYQYNTSYYLSLDLKTVVQNWAQNHSGAHSKRHNKTFIRFKVQITQVGLFLVTPFIHSSSQRPPLPLLSFLWIEVLWQLSSAFRYGISDYPLQQSRALWADSVPGSMGLETMQFSLHGAGSYGFGSLHQCIHGSLHYILTACPDRSLRLPRVFSWHEDALWASLSKNYSREACCVSAGFEFGNSYPAVSCVLNCAHL